MCYTAEDSNDEGISAETSQQHDDMKVTNGTDDCSARILGTVTSVAADRSDVINDIFIDMCKQAVLSVVFSSFCSTYFVIWYMARYLVHALHVADFVDSI